jgi:hypothetical protein
MKTFIAVVASLAVNGSVLGGLIYSADALQAPPLGEVLIVQLPDASLTLADSRQVGPSAARAL